MVYNTTFIDPNRNVKFFDRPWREDTKWTFVNLTPAGSLILMNWRSMISYLSYYLYMPVQTLKNVQKLTHYRTKLFSLQEEQARSSPGKDCTDDGSFFVSHIRRHRHEFTRAVSCQPETSTRATTDDNENQSFPLVFRGI